jgi:hypothetical protein
MTTRLVSVLGAIQNPQKLVDILALPFVAWIAPRSEPL